ncbi:hypothetical protein [Tuwongella immobilis]|uniref:Hypothetical conserved protein n=1 Tax=Tuwongella immobilis TaxID=692036 RepID=A0A6C2YKE3_9BACT|nr:hypothetical protein [Tuwongella immobilis]VIP01699.1 Hypothetical conserved protein OS=uncultured planctomycete GN=HGMM_F07G10C06 PE=4 SV=1 [Tuwongella immobilis]VTR99185.1 Hypothetical conserved protein OS=uncultured planctomycete GN=HGMM_F07G10C06 PE=4 SV=1 [Tuwongella immobilis]
MILGRWLVLVLALSATVALAQTKPPGKRNLGKFESPPTVSMLAAMLLGDPQLQAELKLTSEQRLKLRSTTETGFANYVNAGLQPKQREVLDSKQTESLTSVLQPAQWERLQEITRSELARRVTGPAAIASDAKIVAELKLTPEQVSKLKDNQPIAEVLTESQREVWAKLCGKPMLPRPKIPFGANVQGQMPMFRLPESLGSFLTDAWEQELQLTEAQLQRLVTILEQWLDLFPDANYDLLRTRETELLQACEAVLTETQLRRYLQMKRRMEMQGLSRGYSAPSEPVIFKPVLDELQLTPAQKQQREKLLDAYLKQVNELVRSDTPVKEVGKLSEEAWGKTRQQLLAIFTPEQNQRITELFGPPLRPELDRGLMTPLYPELLWARPEKTYLPPLLANLAVSPYFELEPPVTDAQRKAISDALLRTYPRVPPFNEFAPMSPEQAKANAEVMSKQLAATLSEAQLMRAKEALYRQYVQSSMNAPLSAQVFAIEELMAPLKLTAAQETRIRRGARFGSVLTDEQKALVATLSGKPVPLVKPKPMPGGPAVVPQPRGLPPGWAKDQSFSAAIGSVELQQLRIINHPDIEAELKVTAEQRKALQELAVQASRTLPQRNQGQEKYRADSEKQVERYYGPLSKILTPEQNRRWRQIAFQKMDIANRGLVGLLALRQVQSALKLSPEQIAAITELTESRNRFQISQSLYQAQSRAKAQGGLTAGPSEADIDAIFNVRLQRLLTAEQATQLKELLGPPYNPPRYMQLGGAFAQPPF